MIGSFLCPPDMQGLCRKFCTDISSMGYAVRSEFVSDRAFTVWAEKDLSALDFVLGRWQKLTFTVRVEEQPASEDSEAAYAVTCHTEKTAVADKIFAALLGIFTFLIPWIFSLIAMANQKETVAVAETSVKNFILKQNDAYKEEKTE